MNGASSWSRWKKRLYNSNSEQAQPCHSFTCAECGNTITAFGRLGNVKVNNCTTCIAHARRLATIETLIAVDDREELKQWLI